MIIETNITLLVLCSKKTFCFWEFKMLSARQVVLPCSARCSTTIVPLSHGNYSLDMPLVLATPFIMLALSSLNLSRLETREPNILTTAFQFPFADICWREEEENTSIAVYVQNDEVLFAQTMLLLYTYINMCTTDIGKTITCLHLFFTVVTRRYLQLLLQLPSTFW